MNISGKEAFVSYINNRIDNNDNLNEFFIIRSKITPSPSDVPSLIDLALNKIAENCIDLSEVPTELQTRKLNSAKKFSDWISIRNLCNDDVIQSNSSLLLKERLSKSSEKSDRDLLTHLFNETVFKKCSNKEILEIIKMNRSLQPIRHTTPNKLREVVEEVIKIGSNVINNPIFRFTSSFIFAYLSWKISWKVISLVQTWALFKGLPLLINHVSVNVIKSATWIYDHKWSIYLGAILGSWIMSNLAPSLNRWTFTPLYKAADVVVFLPYHLFTRTFSLTIKVSMKFFNTLPLVGKKIENLNAKLINFRFGQELSQAGRLWTNEIIEDRKQQRQEVEEQLAS